MNTWSKVEDLMDFVKTHDIKELKDYWNHREEEKRKSYVITALGKEVLEIEMKRIERLHRNMEEMRE